MIHVWLPEMQAPAEIVVLHCRVDKTSVQKANQQQRYYSLHIHNSSSQFLIIDNITKFQTVNYLKIYFVTFPFPKLIFLKDFFRLILTRNDHTLPSAMITAIGMHPTSKPSCQLFAEQHIGQFTLEVGLTSGIRLGTV